jgi:thiol-disulfide isomerase/thioredoxin
MQRIILVLVGALLGVGVVIGGMFVVLEYTTLVTDPVSPELPAIEPMAGAEGLPAVVATVNGEAITREMVAAELKISRLNVSQPLPPLTGQDLALAQEEALNQLISRHLILQAATRQGYVLDESVVRQRVDLLFGGYGEAALEAALQQIEASRADVEWWVREIFTVEGYTTQVIMGQAAPEMRQQIYNDWLNLQRSTAEIEIFLNGEGHSLPGQLGQPAPAFVLHTPAGQPLALADFRGQVVLINFWATWCPSCIAEMPAYQAVYQKYGAGQADFVVLAVNLQEEAAFAAQYAAGLGVTFPILLDQDGRVTSQLYQVTGMPASFIIDREGLIFYRHLGPMRPETLEAKLAELGL